MKYFNPETNELVFFHNTRKGNYWDKLWLDLWDKKSDIIYSFNPNSFVCRSSSRFLSPSDGPILEGGCGLGHYLYSLGKMNYDVIGIDNAKDTVDKINEKMPTLKIELGDVRKISYPNDYFAGYWSLGVIEHFIEGYTEIIKEMQRVIKPNGYLFITFPFMSPIRKFKSRFHLYKYLNPQFSNNPKILKNFYQLALNKEKIIKEIEDSGFKLVEIKPQSGIKGLKDEIFFLKFIIRRFLKTLLDANKPKSIHKIKGLIDRILSKFSLHIIFMVFQKTST